MQEIHKHAVLDCLEAHQGETDRVTCDRVRELLPEISSELRDHELVELAREHGYTAEIVPAAVIYLPAAGTQ